MTAPSFRFTRLTTSGKQRTHSLSEVMGGEDVSQQAWLFVSPHDDDLCVGAGLLIQAAVQSQVDVHVLVVTDGRMGYCRQDQQQGIVDIRHRETLESFEILGVTRDKVNYIGYPDGGLVPYVGRRVAAAGEPALGGHVGLQNAFTYYLRKIRPARVFVPTHTDLHPDHQVTNNELMISLFHASGAIWPELGRPLAQVPQLGELAVYCDFASQPNLEIVADEAAFGTKLASIAAYRSQEQIAALVEQLRQAGPYEYVRDFAFRLFSPDNYKHLFA
jgi:LmbE family N-acetylglucosaminyl deacetylase